MNSKEKLAKALLEHYETNMKDLPPEHTAVVRINGMITRAKEGYYSDYDSPLTLPCVQLIRDLIMIGATDLTNRAKNGEFHATKEESNAWYEREGRKYALEVTKGNKELADALFGETKEQQESKEGIKGWDI